jgi:glucose/arabinose dehydrogenase
LACLLEALAGCSGVRLHSAPSDGPNGLFAPPEPRGTYLQAQPQLSRRHGGDPRLGDHVLHGKAQWEDSSARGQEAPAESLHRPRRQLERGEGCVGIALDPRFRTNRFLYVYYTNRSPLQNRVTRFTVRKNRCRRPRHIIRLPSPSTIHQGGQLDFMHGKLFVTVGDGGNAANAQSLNTRLGKVLRYNRDGSIPRNNPFSRPRRRSAIWS